MVGLGAVEGDRLTGEDGEDDERYGHEEQGAPYFCREIREMSSLLVIPPASQS